MNVFYSNTSLKRLAKLDADIRSKIVGAIERLPQTGDIKKMRGRSLEGLYRLRIGKYRILFHWEKSAIKILDVDTRGDIYK